VSIAVRQPFLAKKAKTAGQKAKVLIKADGAYPSDFWFEPSIAHRVENSP
jgi:hypothetical protein